MGYFVGKAAYPDGSGVNWGGYYHTLQEAKRAVEHSGGYIVKTLEIVVKEEDKQ